jgi:Acyl-CoA carboxylase epsilon subunit
MSLGPAEPAAAQARPLLTVVRGAPAPAELAAVTVVIGALARRSSEHLPPQRPSGARWAGRNQLMRPPLSAGPGAWRASALPQH